MRNLTLILCLVALAGTVASGVFWWQIGDSKQRLFNELNQTRARVASLEANLDEAGVVEERLRTALQDTDAELGRTKSTLTDTRHTIATLEEQTQMALAAAEEAHASTTELRTENEALRASLLADRDRFANSVPFEEVARYRAVIADLEEEVARLEQTAASLRQQANQPAVQLTANRGQHAQVVGLGPRNAFVIINFGSRHGALVNQRLSITRGTDALATIEISQTRENYSIAQVLPDSLSGSIRKGDAASLSL